MFQQSLAYQADKFPLKSVLFVKLLLPCGCRQVAGLVNTLSLWRQEYTYTAINSFSALHTYQYLKGIRQYSLIITRTEVLSLSIT